MSNQSEPIVINFRPFATVDMSLNEGNLEFWMIFDRYSSPDTECEFVLSTDRSLGLSRMNFADFAKTDIVERVDTNHCGCPAQFVIMSGGRKYYLHEWKQPQFDGKQWNPAQFVATELD